MLEPDLVVYFITLLGMAGNKLYHCSTMDAQTIFTQSTDRMIKSDVSNISTLPNTLRSPPKCISKIATQNEEPSQANALPSARRLPRVRPRCRRKLRQMGQLANHTRQATYMVGDRLGRGITMGAIDHRDRRASTRNHPTRELPQEVDP